MIFVSAIFSRLSRQMTRATLTAKMALTAKMRDYKKSRTQFWLSETSGIMYHLWLGTGLGLELVSGPYAGFFHQGTVGLYAEKVPNIQRIINMTF